MVMPKPGIVFPIRKERKPLDLYFKKKEGYQLLVDIALLLMEYLVIRIFQRKIGYRKGLPSENRASKEILK